MLSKEEFIYQAKQIEKGINYIDDLSERLNAELWDTELDSIASSAISLLAYAGGFYDKEGLLTDNIFESFWRSNKFKDDENYWSDRYDSFRKIQDEMLMEGK